jgi:hypothetical protein
MIHMFYCVKEVSIRVKNISYLIQFALQFPVQMLLSNVNFFCQCSDEKNGLMLKTVQTVVVIKSYISHLSCVQFYKINLKQENLS